MFSSIYLWYETDEVLEKTKEFLEPALLEKTDLSLVILQLISMSILYNIQDIEK